MVAEEGEIQCVVYFNLLKLCLFSVNFLGFLFCFIVWINISIFPYPGL